MFNQATSDYVCPICLAVQGVEDDRTMIKQADIFYRDELVMALVNSKFVGNNPGHVIVVPLQHYKHLYDLPDEVGERVMNISRQVAVALKKLRSCDGVTILQNNEPAGGQHAFHYHMHVFPRFENDHLHEQMNSARVSKPEERVDFAKKLKSYFSQN